MKRFFLLAVLALTPSLARAQVVIATTYGATASTTLTRPANTTAYTSGTALSTSTVTGTFLTFANVCRTNGGTVLIPQVLVQDAANQTTKLSGTLFLFSSPPGTPIADNATFNVAAADEANRKTAPISFSASTVTNSGSGASGSAEAPATGVTYHFTCAPTSRNAYAMVEVTNAYTPVSAEVFTFQLSVVGVN